MTPEECIETCCVIRCKNTPLNSKVNFFSFPGPEVQKDKWAQAIKNKNGQWWIPNEHSLICSEHFVHGLPSPRAQDEDYVPSVFVNRSRADLKTRGVTLKKFALEYIKHDALLERPCGTNIKSTKRQCAYKKLAYALCIPVSTARSWEKCFRDYFKQKMAESPDKKKRTTEDGEPHWLTVAAQRLHPPPKNRGGLSPDDVVQALAAAAREHKSLCSTALYNDVKRALRIGIPINDLHAIWVAAQRVSLQQVCVWARAGDAAGAHEALGAPPHNDTPPPHVRVVADLVLLHSDVDMHRLVTDDSVTLYEEAAALHTLWRLVQRHHLERPAPGRGRELAQCWTRAHQDYLDSGRFASLVVLQRRWHELKLQARVRLAAHWRRAAPSAPPHVSHVPHVSPRPAPIHIQILKRYPHVATGPFKSWRQLVQDGTIVTEPLKEDSNTEETQDQNNDPAKKTHTMLEPKLEKLAVVEPTVERPDTEPMDDERTEVEPGSEGTASSEPQPTVGKCHTEMTTRNQVLIKESTAVDLLAEKPTVEQSNVNSPSPEERGREPLAFKTLVNEREIEKNSGISFETLVKERKFGVIKKSDLLTVKSTVNQAKPDLWNKPSVKHELLAKSPVASSSGIQGIPGVSIKHMHRNKGILANSSDTDSDDDNLVIDECSKKSPSPLKREPVARTETHSVDTVLAPKTFETIAPTIAVLQMIDPSTVKTEILFDSDDEDFQPCIEEDRVEIEVDIKKEPSYIADKLVFADEEPVVRHLNQENDVTERVGRDVMQRMDCDVTQSIDCEVTERIDSDVTETDELVADTPTIDPKLLLDTKIRLFRIDKIKAWKKNVRKDNSIKPSRIHWRFHTPNPAAYYRTKSGRFTAVNPENNKDTPISNNDALKSINDTLKSNNDNLNTNSPKSQEIEIKVDQSCLDKVANIESVRELSRTIKRELIDVQLEAVEDITPYKRVKTESEEEDDQPLLMIRENKPYFETTSDTEVEHPDTADDSDIVQSSGDEYLDEWTPQKDCAKGKRRLAHRAAAAIACRAEQPRVAKRVRLPDREQLRRHAAAARVAQVAPISSTTEGEKAARAPEPPGDAADDDTPLAWRALDLPAGDQLEAALDELTSASAAAAVLESSQCCAARRQRDVNDARRRLGAAEVPLHIHPTGECTCCCAHLLEGRALLGRQLHALYADIQRLLTKPGDAKNQSKPVQKLSSSQSPVFIKIKPKPASKDMPSTITTEAKNSKTKAKPATCRNRSKKCPQKAQEAPPAPPAPPVDHYEEWQRQKTLNAKYFHINSCSGPRKDKKTSQSTVPNSSTPQGTNPESANLQSTAPQSTAPQCTTPQRTGPQITNPQYTAPQSTTPNSTTLQGTTLESTTPQSTAPQSTTKKSTARKSTTPKKTTPQNTVLKSTISQSVVTLQHSPGGLMPYIRESRLVASETRLVQTIEVPTLVAGSYPVLHVEYPVAVPYPVGIPYPVDVSYPFRRDNLAYTLPDPPLHKNASGSILPDSPLHKNAFGSILPDSPLHKNAFGSILPDSPLHKKTIITKLPYSPLRKKVISTKLPDPSLHTISKRTLAPKPESMRLAAMARHHTVKEKLIIQDTAISTTPAACDPLPSRMNMTTDQVTASQVSTPELVAKSVSILEEYARTLSGPVSNVPVVNGVTIRVPDGAKGQKTTVLLSVNLPSKNVAKQTQGCLYANDSIDLTDNPENSSDKTTDDARKPQLIDTVGMVNSLLNAGNKNDRSLLKLSNNKEPSNNTRRPQMLNFEITKRKHKPPTIMSLSNKLHDGDIIEIDDDSDDDGKSIKSPMVINKSSNPAVYSNKSSNVAKCDNTKTVNERVTEESPNQAIASTSNPNKVSKQATRNINRRSIETKSSNAKIFVQPTSVTDAVINQAAASTCNTYKNIGAIEICYSNKGNEAIEATTSNQATVNTNKDITDTIKPMITKQANSSTNNELEATIEATTSNQATVNTNKDITDTFKPMITKQANSSTNNELEATTSNQATVNTNKDITDTIKPMITMQANSSTNNEIEATIEATTSNHPTTTTTINTNKNVNIKAIINMKYAAAMRRVPTANQTTLSNMCKIAAIRHVNNTESTSEDATETSMTQRTQLLKSPTEDSGSCNGSFANVAAMPEFMDQLRRTAAHLDGDVYCLNKSALKVAAGALRCGVTLLCVDGHRPPLVLPTREIRNSLREPNSPPHLVLTDADLPCELPTYWTLAAFSRMRRVLPDELLVSGPRDVTDAEVTSADGCSSQNAEQGKPEQGADICVNNHQFKILTAFCSLEGARQAARAGARLYLLTVRSALLRPLRAREPGGAQHRAPADVTSALLWELENYLGKMEIDDPQSGEVDVADK